MHNIYFLFCRNIQILRAEKKTVYTDFQCSIFSILIASEAKTSSQTRIFSTVLWEIKTLRYLGN